MQSSELNVVLLHWNIRISLAVVEELSVKIIGINVNIIAINPLLITRDVAWLGFSYLFVSYGVAAHNAGLVSVKQLTSFGATTSCIAEVRTFMKVSFSTVYAFLAVTVYAEWSAD